MKCSADKMRPSDREQSHGHGKNTVFANVQEKVDGALKRAKTPAEKIGLFILGTTLGGLPKIMSILRRPNIEKYLDETILTELNKSLNAFLLSNECDIRIRVEALDLIGKIIEKRKELSLISVNG